MKAKSAGQFLNNLHEMLRVGMFSLLNSHKYDKDNILYPYVNFRTLVNIMLAGKRDYNSFEIIKRLYGTSSCAGGEKLDFNGIQFPVPEDKEEIVSHLLLEICDLILPYLITDKRILNGVLVEGPYEINEHVSMRPGDVIIDCGANIGIFSAVACNKGCNVYAFEPMPHIIERYLCKTKEWNERQSDSKSGTITIAPYALSDKTEDLEFVRYTGAIGDAHRADIRSTSFASEGEERVSVHATTLDKYASDIALKRVDFIKADIEGSERYMLMGAQDIIREFCPKLSICTYHLPDDPKVIRQLILKANPKYKILQKYKKLYAWVE